MGRWLLLTLVLTTCAVGAAPAWKWVDANGVTHYSDRPVEGAEVIELPDAGGVRPTGVASARQARSFADAPVDASLQVAEPYRRFDIVSPAQQETLWNIGGTLLVEVALQPSLQNGHQLDIVYDGIRQSLNSTAPQMTLTEVFRGAHTIQAVILDATGAELLRSQPLQVMVQQTSIQNPNNPNRPGAAN